MQKLESKRVAEGATGEVVENKGAQMTGVDDKEGLGLKDVTPTPRQFVLI
jgi:hypothetical protein